MVEKLKVRKLTTKEIIELKNKVRNFEQENGVTNIKAVVFSIENHSSRINKKTLKKILQ